MAQAWNVSDGWKRNRCPCLRKEPDHSKAVVMFPNCLQHSRGASNSSQMWSGLDQVKRSKYFCAAGIPESISSVPTWRKHRSTMEKHVILVGGVAVCTHMADLPHSGDVLSFLLPALLSQSQRHHLSVWLNTSHSLHGLLLDYKLPCSLDCCCARD